MFNHASTTSDSWAHPWEDLQLPKEEEEQGLEEEEEEVLEDRLKRSGRFTIFYLNDLAFGQGKLL